MERIYQEVIYIIGNVYKIEEVLVEDYSRKWVAVIEFDKLPNLRLGECEVKQ